MDYSQDRPEADNPLQVMDVSLRDGQQSLFGARGRTEDMVAVAERMDGIGFWAVEIWGGATFEIAHRLLNEDPWERIRALKGIFKQTPLSMVVGAQTLVGHRNYPDDVCRAFIEAAAANGIDIFRTIDALNDLRNFEVVFETVKAAGKHFQGCLCYALTEPRMGGDLYHLDYFVGNGKALEGMGVDSICLLDPAGLLAPYDAYTLIDALKEATSVPIHLHSRFSSGMAPMTHLKAIEAGVDMVDTCLSPYGYRTSLPAVEPLVTSLLGTNRDTGLDLARLAEINGSLEADILPKYRHLLDESKVSIIDTDVMSHQVPAGMVADIRRKLEEMDARDRIDRVHEELAAVRRELGQVPLVAPVCRIVSTQTINNLVYDDEEERYKMIADQTRELCAGRYGRTPGPIDPDLREKVLDAYPGEEAQPSDRPAEALDSEMARAKDDVADLATGLEDEVLCALFPVSGRQFLKWKYGVEEPPSSVRPKTLDDAEMEQAMITRIRAGESIDMIDPTVAGEGENLRIFNVSVDDEYFRVGVAEIGGAPEISYLKPMPSPGTRSAPAGQKVSGPRPVQPPPAQPSSPAPAAAAKAAATPAVDGTPLLAPMPGTIVAYEKQVGDAVSEGDTVLVLEAMKMENALPAPASGVITAIDYKGGDSVAKGDVLCVIG